MSNDPFEELKSLVKTFIQERNWQKYHTPKNLSMSIAIESAEILELFQWYTNEEALEKIRSDPKLKLALEDELADVLIYVLSMSNICEIDLTNAIRKKLKTNEKRFPIDIVSGCLGPYKLD
ncbi:MAG: nucleotide pyrophosphohydrolase [Candidatus Heimdallarchaeota archaeon]|nr:nucleotide pyrophosphohydrolase [Candidatus Heimdallarchaeota archaeon]